MSASSSDVWYFAYGANMSARVLARRRLRPLASEPARLEGYRLAFSHAGLLPIEPAFANLERDPAGVVPTRLLLPAFRPYLRASARRIARHTGGSAASSPSSEGSSAGSTGGWATNRGARPRCGCAAWTKNGWHT